MRRPRSRILAALATGTLALTGLALAAPPAAPLSDPAPLKPQLTYVGALTSHPFPGAPGNAIDIEGLGYVPTNPGDTSSMWVADDNGDRVWEINLLGGYKSQLRGGNPEANAANASFLNATQVGTGLKCGDTVDPTYFQSDGVTPADTAGLECLSRTDDLESVVYDASADVLYVTSGNCCNAGLPTVYYWDNTTTPATLKSMAYPYHPTVWKLTRVGGHFTPTSWQALPDGEDPTAMGWRPGTGLYYGKSNYLRTYDFATNTIGSKKTFSGLGGDIVGVSFPDATTALITTATPNTASGRTTADSDSTIRKFTVSGSTFTQASGWTFPLKSVGDAAAGVDKAGMIDARDLAVVGDTLYVSDGYDSRASGDHPIYLYSLSGATLPAPAFSWAQTGGLYTVQFTSTGTPGPVSTTPSTTFTWSFGDGTTSNLASPLHSYPTSGTFNAKLTVANAAGSTPVTQTVSVAGPQWRFEALNGPGSGVSGDHFGGGNSLFRYGGQFQALYANSSRASLGHSWWDGIRWNYENLDGAGRNTTDAVGANVTGFQYGGQVQAFYTDATTHTLRHGWWDGIRWNFETLDGPGAPGGGGRTSDWVAGGAISVRQYGYQIQAYYTDDTTHRLRHAWWDGIRWNFEPFDASTAIPSTGPSVTTAQSGAAFHVFYKTAANKLQHSWWDGLLTNPAWHTEVLDGSGGGSGRTSHAVGDYATATASGAGLDVFYQDTTSQALRHAKSSGSSWSFETLDGTGGIAAGATTDAVGTHIAALAYGGGLHVVYQDTSTGAQRHAWYDTSWHAETLDGTGSVWPGASNSINTGRTNALAEYGGQLHATYFDEANGGKLRHSWYG